MHAGIGQKGGEERRLRVPAAGQTALPGHAAADERAGVAGVHDEQLFALDAADEVVQVLRAQRRFRLAVAQEQIDLPVVRGGEDAVRAQVEDGKVALDSLVKGVVKRCAQGLLRADGAILDGQAAQTHARAEERGADHVQVAGDGCAQVHLGDEVRAGDQQRARICQRREGQGEQQKHRRGKRADFFHASSSLPLCPL